MHADYLYYQANKNEQKKEIKKMCHHLTYIIKLNKYLYNVLVFF